MPSRESDQVVAGVAGDFPDWLDPMVVKELRQGLRARWFVVPFVAVQAAAVALIWLEYLATRRTGTPFASVEVGHALFWGLVFLMVGVVLPLRSLTGLGGELTGDGARLILLAGLSRWRIVMGKWLAQMVLAGLVLVSLVPFGLVRYFFGGVEFLPNAVALLSALGLAAAMNALLLGASGYEEYWMRALVAATGWLYVGLPAVGLPLLLQGGESLSSELGAGGLLGGFWVAWSALGVLLSFAYFCLCGLQLARSRLRTGTHPWEVAPSRPVLVLFFLAPLYFGILNLVTCGFGFPVVAGAMLWWMWSLDPADFAVRSEMHFIHPEPSVVPKKYWF